MPPINMRLIRAGSRSVSVVPVGEVDIASLVTTGVVHVRQ